ncbi:UNVERIFIED_CONTAM: hypothetical protein Cloal_0725 [Acetivibrio alkalicellulosi]
MRLVHVSTDFYSYEFIAKNTDNQFPDKILLAHKGFPINSRKPESIGYVSNKVSLPDNRFYVTFKRLMEAVATQGMSFSPTIFEDYNRSQAGFIGGEMVALDIDTGLTMQEALDIANLYGVPPNCIYESFSSTPQLRKFRLVWLLDHFVTNEKAFRFIIEALDRIFDCKADRQAKEPSRLYFGSNNGIWYYNEGFELSISNLTSAVMTKIENLYSKNIFKKKQQEFFESQGILWENSSPQIGIIGVDREKRVENHIYYICNSTSNSQLHQMEIETPDDPNSPYLVRIGEDILSVTLCHTYRGAKTKNTRPENYKIDPEDFKKCPLIETGLKGQLNEPPLWLYDPALWNMVRNLALFKGGEKLFKEIMNSNPVYWQETILNEDGKQKTYKKAQHYIKRFKDIRKINDVKPSKCSEEVCPLFEKCKWQGTMYSKIKPMKRRPQVEDIPVISLQEGQKLLEQYFIEAVDQTDKVTLLKAPTAIGKTQMVIKWLKDNKRTSLIAVPTHKLAAELEQRLEASGVEVLRLLPLPTWEDLKQSQLPIEQVEYLQFYSEIANLKRTGYYGTVFAKEQDMFNHLCKYQTTKKFSCVYWDYYAAKINAQTHKGNLIMTHDQLMYWDKPMQDTIIIDECPSNSLNKQGVAKNKDIIHLKSLLSHSETWENKDITPIVLDFLQGVLDLPYEKPTKIEPPLFNEQEFSELLKSFRYDLKTGDTNFWQLFSADCVFKQNEEVTFRQKNHIKRGELPMAILSATPNEFLLKHFYSDLQIKEVPPLKAVGTLKHYWKYACSKKYFKARHDFKDFMENVVFPITGRNVNILTYKKYYDLYKDEMPIVGYFFNTAGRDEWKAKDLVVVGVPWQDPSMWKLEALSLGIDIENKDFNCQYNRVNWNDRTFYFNVFDDPELREMQMYSIEAELLQTIGRARHLRHDVTVYYFGNFPLPQAIIID